MRPGGGRRTALAALRPWVLELLRGGRRREVLPWRRWLLECAGKVLLALGIALMAIAVLALLEAGD